MLSDISGSFIIAQTPFDDRGAVDFTSIDSLTDFYLSHGANRIRRSRCEWRGREADLTGSIRCFFPFH